MKKFRVWDSERQAYRKAGELSFNLDNQTWYFNQANYQDIIIEESTGLHDCNGVEIFQGDRFKNKSDKIFVVVWDDATARFGVEWESEPDYGIMPIGRQWVYDSEVEVIGNIHSEDK